MMHLFPFNIGFIIKYQGIYRNGSGKIREKSGNFVSDSLWAPCTSLQSPRTEDICIGHGISFALGQWFITIPLCTHGENHMCHIGTKYMWNELRPCNDRWTGILIYFQLFCRNHKLLS